ncbi:carboxypeptidase-like regulatory domain-containing protein [Hymenobacter cellulosilyticus]|uniref:Carboxypeptidase-like regulatory domain-containing protein n=1 Tax=Hymenobacter cellulosilyticus TaxID=2932248 RepID=A0A8T9Q968_9BACT|nr:carboxypeptidase-like regulatory domain-containing protein [Hymenobacter cellulosilyticus]UOQ73675.1 carboxypeptidase-like regulatory domain-containing protein [Hymenobacter cellulosilyticus]
MNFRFLAAARAACVLWLLLVLAATGVAQAAQQPSECTLSLSGRATDHESREGLPGATVVLLETQQATQTDAAGNYHFHVCAGLYHVQITYLGYSNEVAEVRVAEAVIRDFRLHPDAILLNSALVQGQRTAAPTTQPTAVLSGQALQQTRGRHWEKPCRKWRASRLFRPGRAFSNPWCTACTPTGLRF